MPLRNRLAACALAEVVPAVRQQDGDPAAFILSVNVNRRHMTAGQRAMARAMLAKDVSAGRKKGNLANLQDLTSNEQSQISRARFILRHDEHLAKSVINGSVSLNEAYKTTKDRVDRTDAEQERRREDEEDRRAKLDDLRRRYPDLASKVEEETLSLKAARIEADERDTAAC